MRSWLPCGFTLLATLAAGCVIGSESGGPAGRLLPLDEALARRDRGQAVLVDVRSAEAFAEGHIPGAISIPFGEIASRVAELRKTGKLPILYCG